MQKKSVLFKQTMYNHLPGYLNKTKWNFLLVNMNLKYISKIFNYIFSILKCLVFHFIAGFKMMKQPYYNSA